MFIQVLNGLVQGSLLLLIATGLAMMYGLRGIVNFGHGAIYALGAYIGFAVATSAGFWAALLVAPVTLAVLGWALDRSTFRPLRDRSVLDLVLLTLGAALVITDGIRLVWGSNQQVVSPPALMQQSVTVMGQTYPTYRLFVLMLALVVGVGLLLLLSRTRFGLQVRAARQSPEVAAMMGVHLDRVGTTVVALAFGLAGLAGVVAAPLFTVTPDMGAAILVQAFLVMVLGGLASIGGAMVAAIALGMVTVLAIAYLGVGAAVAPYLLAAAILIWRPRGLSGVEA